MAEVKEKAAAMVSGLFQTADWKKEKHVPVIDAPGSAKKGEFFKISVCVGKDIPHPNTTAHHIRWITVFFLPDGEKFPYQIGRSEFTSHGESALGADTSTVFTHSEVVLTMKTDKPGTIMASSYCNIHGLWQDWKKIEIK
ncbi:MAG: class II SORL domain-containing protein [Candidatus Omnitrophica bacterium]|nr:class II SORL domain-containing protein [Candidatus Omnitrophota bacterium]MDD5436590.1 class II SORL domain-containing protein [Candidatus Omnitrophota bacterium]